jgi:hypothetical protein
MTQKFSRLGAVIYFPIILNIFVITVAYNFGLTRVITGLILLANIYLLCWDFELLKYIFFGRKTNQPNNIPLIDDYGQNLLWIITGLIMCGSIIAMRFVKVHLSTVFLSCFLIGLSGLIVFIFTRIVNSKKHPV